MLLPESIDHYIEPFLGSGAVFFHVAPKTATLSDVNTDLIDTYTAIQHNAALVEKALRKHHASHSEEYYYHVRDQKPKALHLRAARFIYLNRTCWNGLYRVNLKGVFNVPVGTKTSVILDTDDFSGIEKRLAGVKLICSDFEAVLNSARPGDFAFVDPPYTVAHNMNGFIKYNERLFTWQDQIRLKDAVERATNRGVKVLVLNANHKSVRELYQGIGEHHILQRSSVLAASSARRRSTEELAIQCWR